MLYVTALLPPLYTIPFHLNSMKGTTNVLNQKAISLILQYGILEKRVTCTSFTMQQTQQPHPHFVTLAKHQIGT